MVKDLLLVSPVMLTLAFVYKNFAGARKDHSDLHELLIGRNRTLGGGSMSNLGVLTLV